MAADRAEFRGIQSLSAVISALEKRYLDRQSDEEEEEEEEEVAVEEDAAAAAPAKKKRARSSRAGAKKLKPTKEEEELIRDGEGFVDNSEVVIEEEEGEAIPVIAEQDDSAQKSKFVAVRLDSNLTSTSSDKRQSETDGSSSRAKFLAEHLDDWNPPQDVQQKLFALEDALRKGFETPKDWNTRRRKGLGSIEILLLKVDHAARKALPNQERTLGYIARLVHAFPDPFSRGKVIAHLERALLKRSLRRKEKRMHQRAKEAVEALTKRLQEGNGVAQPPPPNVSSATMQEVDLSPLERVGDPNDAAVISCLQEITLAVGRETPSPETLRRLHSLLQQWATRNMPQLALDQPPPDAFVAAREVVERMQQTDPYFAWDGSTRGAMFALGQACKACANARMKLSAWVVERRDDLLLGLGEGVPRNYRPKPKTLEQYCLEAEEFVQVNVFKHVTVEGIAPAELERIGRQANLMRALREPPATYYFVNDSGDYIPYTGPPKPVVILLPLMPADDADTAAQAQPPMSATIVSPTPDDAFEPSSTGKLATSAKQLSSTAAIAPSITSSSVQAAPSSAVAPVVQQAKDHFAPSKGKKFQKPEWRMEDFQVGGFISHEKADTEKDVTSGKSKE